MSGSGVQFPTFGKPYLDPASAKLAASIPASIASLPLPELAKAFGQINQGYVPSDDVAKSTITVKHKGNDVKTYIFKPSGASGPLPFMFYIHGGAFILGE
jgi:acetyl esterase/lipase